jgi:heptosyltransferase-2
MIFRLINFFFKAKPFTDGEINPEEIKKILVVKQHNQFGDMLCTYPIFPALKKRFTTAKITLVASKENSIFLKAGTDPYIDELLIYKKFNLWNLIKFIIKIRKVKYDIGIVPSTVSISRTSHLINALSKARIKVGVKSLDGKENKYSSLLNLKKDFDWRGKEVHQKHKNLEIVKQIGAELTTEEINNIRINLDDEEIRNAQNIYIKYFPDKSKMIIGIHCGAGKIQNRWDVKKFAELMEKMNKEYNCYFYCSNGPMDGQVSKELEKNLEGKNVKYKIIKDNGIIETAAMISLCNMFISNDTGIMHIADYTGVKVISLFAETKGYEWASMRKNCIYIQSKTENINDIEVDEVFNTSIKLLTNS